MRTVPNSKPSPSLTALIGILIFIALGAGVEWALFEYGLQQTALQKSRTAFQREIVRARLEGELNAVVFLSNGIAGYWSVRPDFSASPDPRDILAELFRQSRHVRSLGIVVGYRMAHVFPLNDDGQSAGFDFSKQTDQWQLVRRVIETRSPILDVPTPASRGLTYLTPIFVEGQYWGMVSTLVDEHSLFSSAGMSRTSGEYQYALCANGENCTKQHLVLGSIELFNDPEAAVTDINVPGGIWRLAVKPASVSVPKTWSDLFRGLGWMFAALFAAQSITLLSLNRKIDELALYDDLTGLPSRHLFQDRLKQTIRRTKRNRGNFSVLFIALNKLESINEIQGPKVGSMILAGMGKRLIGSIRHCDTVTRWGNDEFLILLDACPFDQAGIIAENLRHKIELPVSYGERQLRVGASIGLATYPEDGQSLTALLKVAENRASEDKPANKG